jgi:hypothetical protein
MRTAIVAGRGVSGPGKGIVGGGQSSESGCFTPTLR